jgi:MFS family permease
MAVYSVGAFLGTGCGPAISGYVALKAGWRWVEWVQVRLFVLFPLIPRLTFSPSFSVLLPAPNADDLVRRPNRLHNPLHPRNSRFHHPFPPGEAVEETDGR